MGYVIGGRSLIKSASESDFRNAVNDNQISTGVSQIPNITPKGTYSIKKGANTASLRQAQGATLDISRTAPTFNDPRYTSYKLSWKDIHKELDAREIEYNNLMDLSYYDFATKIREFLNRPDTYGNFESFCNVDDYNNYVRDYSDELEHSDDFDDYEDSTYQDILSDFRTYIEYSRNTASLKLNHVEINDKVQVTSSVLYKNRKIWI